MVGEIGYERVGALGGDVHFSDGIACQGDDFQEFAGDYGRIDERCQRAGGEMDFVAALAGNRKR